MPTPDRTAELDHGDELDLLHVTTDHRTILGAIAALSQKRRRELFRILSGGWCAACGRRKRGGGPCPQCRPGGERS